jgi:hypothetical protein
MSPHLSEVMYLTLESLYNGFEVSVEQFLARLCATQARHCLSGHIRITIIVAKLFQRVDVAESKKGDAR